MFNVPLLRRRRSGLSASLALDFTAGALDSRITFSRPSLATLYDSTGKLTYAPNNLSLHSQNFSGGVWGASNFTRTTGQSDPFGGTGATLGTFTSNGGDGLLQTSLNLVADKSYVVSIYAKYGTWRWFEFTTVSGGAIRSFVDMETGVAGNVAHSNFAVTPVGNGWYRISARVAGANEFYWTPRQANGNASAATTNNGATFYIYGFQAEAVTYQTTPLTYVATTTSAYYGPRFDYNPSTLAARGLLSEEARTNVAVNSAAAGSTGWTAAGGGITADTLAAPDGTTSADTFTENTSNTVHYNYQTLVTTANTVYAVSRYYKYKSRQYMRHSFVTGGSSNGIYADIDLINGTIINQGAVGTGALTSASIENVGNGWYRVTVVGKADTVSTSTFAVSTLRDTSTNVTTEAAQFYLGDGVSGAYVWGLQVELGAFATSYIPTGASSVARSADSVSVSSLAFPNAAFTILHNFELQTNAYQLGDLYYSVTPENNRLNWYGDLSALNFFYKSGGTNQFTGSVNPGAGISKFALAVTTNDAAASIDGGAATSVSTSFAIGSNIDTLKLGGNYASTAGRTWHRSLAIYASRLPNATLQSLTT